MKALQLLGLDENVTAKELQKQWRFLSSHTHPDRFPKDSPEFKEALLKQTRLNCARDRILSFIKERDSENTAEPQKHEETHSEEPQTEEHKTRPNTQEPEVSTPVETITLEISQGVLHELATVGIFLGTMFIGVAAASIVSAMLPFLATSAPIILITVMLTTMGGAFVKLRDWCQSYEKAFVLKRNGDINVE